MFSQRHSFVLIASALLNMTALCTAHAADSAEQSYQFDIPAESLSQALTDFSRTSSRPIIFSEELVKGHSTLSLHGSFTARDALDKLIAGTGLRIVTDPSGVLMIKTASHANANDDTETVIVLGQGETRQTQTIKPAELAKHLPGTSPMQVLSELPGVNYLSSDPLGAYESSNQISIRGFLTDQMGYTLDGVPLGSMRYRNSNGLSINRALEAENQGPVTLSQGSASLGTASTSNIGGTIDFTSINPTDQFGVDVAQTVGSATDLRTFARLNSGTLPGDGRFYLSYNHQDADKWKGYGSQYQDQLNFKYIQPLSDNLTATTFLDAVDRTEDDYASESLDEIKRVGYKADNYSNNFALAEAVARGAPLPAPYNDNDNLVYNEGGLRQDVLLYEKLDYNLTPTLSGQTTAYFHHNHGMGTWADQYDPTPQAYGGSPLSVNTLGYAVDRPGLISNLSYPLGDHVLKAGLWYEHIRFDETDDNYGLQAGVAPKDFQHYYSNPFMTNWHYLFNTDVYQVHVGDGWDVNDALHIDLGMKALFSSNTAKTITPGKNINGTISANDPFLPTIGALYKFDLSNQLFADYTRNMAGYIAEAANGPFSATSQAAFDYVRGNLKPEKTHTFETGYRYSNDAFQASVTGYYVLFENRLLASPVNLITVGNQNVLQNVGGVTSRGVELAANWVFAPNWSLHGTWSFNDARYDDNVAVPLSNQVVATKGKEVVDTPRTVGGATLSYDDGSLWSQLAGHYHGQRYYSYLNDAAVKGAFVADFNAGYRFRQGWLEGAELVLNVTNLFDEHYIASIDSNPVSDPNGTQTVLQVAAPRQAFLTVRKHF
jgi:iron complex outermembrane receptor protein